MLIRMNKSKYHNEFNTVLDFIDRLLEYACLNQKFVKKKFLTHFNSGDSNGPGAWYLSKSRTKNGPVVAGYMKLFSDLTIQERILIRDAFRNDIHFHAQYDTDTFCFQSPMLSKKLKVALNRFIVPFYSEIFNKTGFDKIGTFSQYPFERSFFLKGYTENNKDNVALCPACLCELDITAELIADLDHYFPKHEYPALAIQPDNLIPVCLDCNERIKLQENPLDTAVTQGTIQRAFIPYKHEGIDEMDLEIMVLKKTVQLKATSTEDAAVARVKNFNRIYNLSGRWPERLVNLYDSLMNDLAADDPDWNDLEPWFRRKLENRRVGSEKGKRNLPLSYLRMKLLDTLLVNTSQFNVALDDLRMRR